MIDCEGAAGASGLPPSPTPTSPSLIPTVPASSTLPSVLTSRHPLLLAPPATLPRGRPPDRDTVPDSNHGPECAFEPRPALPRDGTIAPTQYGEAAIGWIGGRYLEQKKQSIRKIRSLSDAMAAPAPPEDQVRLLSDALEAVRHQTGLMRKCLDMPGKLMDALKCWYVVSQAGPSSSCSPAAQSPS